tara:strand:+ start:1067 stop:2065 length:999 start_codon:yes stop_codon:yes gene_type:complete
MNIFIFLTIILILNFIFLLNFKKISIWVNLYDEPNNVKIHKKKVSCFGGFIFAANIILFTVYGYLASESNFIKSELFFSKRSFFSFFMISFLFLMLGFFDDKFKISSNRKLILQSFFIILALLIEESLLITILKLSIIYEINLLNLSILFSTLCFLIFVNAFNMFDGINNQVSIYIFIICAYLLFKTDNNILILAIIFSNLIFFYLNFRGKIFLGDNGTLLMAYVLSYLIVKEHNMGQIKNSLEIVVLMFFPVADLIRLFFIRLIKNKHPFSGDKTHLHHLLLRKSGLIKTNIYISISIIIPIIVTIINVYLALFISAFLYTCLIFYAKKIV